MFQPSAKAFPTIQSINTMLKLLVLEIAIRQYSRMLPAMNNRKQVAACNIDLFLVPKEWPNSFTIVENK